MNVRGARAIAGLCGRCLGVLVVVNVIGLGIVHAVQGSGGASQSGVTAALVYLPAAALVAAALIVVVGFPAGLLTASVLARQSREWVHVLAFALVGATLSVMLCASWSILGTVGWEWAVAAAEGAVGAGAARWWSGRAHARSVPWTDSQGAALPWGRMGP